MQLDWEQAYREGYFKNWDFGQASSELVATIAVRGLAKPGEKALDIGCGGGWESIFLAQCGYEVTGVDLSQNAIELAKKRAEEAGVTVNFKQGNALNLPVEDESIDFANDRGCFHVLSTEDREAYVKEVQRVLKPGGVLLLRGCRSNDIELERPVNDVNIERGDMRFNIVTKEVIDQFFSHAFISGPVLPLKLIGGEHWLPGNIVFLQKR